MLQTPLSFLYLIMVMEVVCTFCQPMELEFIALGIQTMGALSKSSVKNIYDGLRKKYPNANVHESTFDDFYDVASKNLVGLPVITKEIGDTWLYGVPSDPFKNVKFRELSRHRRECIERGVCDVADITMQRFDRLLTKIPEHTWGKTQLGI